MADLREQLRRIEAAEPPDLWAGIESREREESPEMDTNVGSVVAFRKPGSEQRRRVAAGLLAAAVVALTSVVAWRAFQDASPEPLPPGTDTTMPDGWVRCTNTAVGHSIGYPGDWFTTDVFDGQSGSGERLHVVLADPVRPRGQRRRARDGATHSRSRSAAGSTRSSSRCSIPS